MPVFSHIVIRTLFNNKMFQLKGSECLGSFLCFMLCPKMTAAEKHWGISCITSLLVHPSPQKKNEIYRLKKYSVSKIYGDCAFHYFCMVFVIY